MNPGSWFEVPVTDMDRAIKFYNTVFDWNLKVFDAGPLKMAWFPANEEDHGAGGSLVLSEHYTPGSDGVLVYFHCMDVAMTIARVEGAGGKVVLEKKLISPEVGYMAAAIDSEGNRIAFHSKQ